MTDPSPAKSPTPEVPQGGPGTPETSPSTTGPDRADAAPAGTVAQPAAAPDIAARGAAAAKTGAVPPPRDGRPAAAARPPAGPATPPASLPPASRGAGAVLTALAVALLAGGLGWVWHQQEQFAERAVQPADVAALREQVRTLQQRIAQIEQRPAPAPAAAVDLRPVESRLAALEQRPAASAAPDAALQDRLAALDGRLREAEQATAQARQAATDAQAQAVTAGKDAIDRAARLARVQAAVAALEAGRPLGALAGAPPSVARFATAAPPTEAALRLSFPEAAARARAASRAEESQGIGERVWQRVRNLVTVREGDTVLVGSPAANALGQAAGRLTAGDLAGAVAALDGLDPAAAAAIADWRGQAEALLAARAALRSLLAA